MQLLSTALECLWLSKCCRPTCYRWRGCTAELADPRSPPQTAKHAKLAARKRMTAEQAQGFLSSGLFRYSRHPNFW